jgi:hypothetical protein
MSPRLTGPTNRLRMRKARRGWVIGVLAALTCAGGGSAAEALAGGDGRAPVCVPTTTTTTATTDVATVPAAVPPTVTTPTETTAADTGERTLVCPDGTTLSIPAPVPPAATTTGAAPRPAEEPQPAAEPVGQKQASQGTSGAGRVTPVRGHHQRRHAAGAVEVAGDHKAKAHKHARAHRHARRPPVAQTYFPAVSIDWTLLTPLAPPPLPGVAAHTFPGPLFLLPIYEAAATKYNVPWQVLASINEVESAWGRNQGPSSAGAIGWMQFMPSTWKRWGIDANGDGIKNPHDPVDAIFSAARYLHAAHADDDLGQAIFAYNHANWYVDDVVRRAIELGQIREDVLAALVEKGRHQAKAIRRVTGSRGLIDRHAQIQSLGQAMLLGDRRLRRLVLHAHSIKIYGCGREDISHKVIDRRVLEVLRFLVGHNLKPTVTSLRCGHGYYTTSGNVSEHSSGDAVDISAINGIPILGHQGPGSITETTIRALLKLGGAMKPHQIISLMTFDGATNTLSLPDHANHIHIGFAPMRKIAEL